MQYGDILKEYAEKCREFESGLSPDQKENFYKIESLRDLLESEKKDPE